jgi:hypothetical protein
MITISTNQNFKDWLNIRIFGKLVDNAKSRARANHIANKLSIEHRIKTGERLTIINKK